MRRKKHPSGAFLWAKDIQNVESQNNMTNSKALCRNLRGIDAEKQSAPTPQRGVGGALTELLAAIFMRARHDRTRG